MHEAETEMVFQVSYYKIYFLTSIVHQFKRISLMDITT